MDIALQAVYKGTGKGNWRPERVQAGTLRGHTHIHIPRPLHEHRHTSTQNTPPSVPSPFLPCTLSLRPLNVLLPLPCACGFVFVSNSSMIDVFLCFSMFSNFVGFFYDVLKLLLSLKQTGRVSLSLFFRLCWIVLHICFPNHRAVVCTRSLFQRICVDSSCVTKQTST